MSSKKTLGETMNRMVHGEIKVSNDVLRELAGFAALECYGVVGMSNPTLRAGVGQILSRDKLKKGVKVATENGKVKFSLYVIVEYGVNMAEVANNLMEKVKYIVEKYTLLEVDSVDVYVQGVKIRK